MFPRLYAKYTYIRNSYIRHNQESKNYIKKKPSTYSQKEMECQDDTIMEQE